MLESKLRSFPAKLAQQGGWGEWEELKLKLTQPQVELETWVKLDNMGSIWNYKERELGSGINLGLIWDGYGIDLGLICD